MRGITYGRAVALAFSMFMHVVLKGAVIFVHRRKSDHWHMIAFEQGAEYKPFRFEGTPAELNHMYKRTKFFSERRDSK